MLKPEEPQDMFFTAYHQLFIMLLNGAAYIQSLCVWDSLQKDRQLKVHT